MIESAKYPLESSKHGTYKRIADEYARGLKYIAKLYKEEAERLSELYTDASILD